MKGIPRRPALLPRPVALLRRVRSAVLGIALTALAACTHELAAPSPPRTLGSSPSALGIHLGWMHPELGEAVDELAPGVVRLNLRAVWLRRWLAARADFDWSEIDQQVRLHRGRRILLTLYPYLWDEALGRSRPPADRAEEERFLDFVGALALRYGSSILDWQLDNEVTLDGHPWRRRLDTYARLLAAMSDRLARELPRARVVCAGLPGVGAVGGAAEAELLAALDRHGVRPVLDLHHHRAWYRGAELGDRIREWRAWLQQHRPSLASVPIVVSENTTWSGPVVGLDPQTEGEQSAHAVLSVYSAWAAGAEYCMVGVLRDRFAWGEEEEHRFSRNGLFRLPEIRAERWRLGPAKALAATFRAIGRRVEGSFPVVARRVERGPTGLVFIEVGGRRPHAVVWWQGPGELAIRLRGRRASRCRWRSPTAPAAAAREGIEAGASTRRGDRVVTLRPFHPRFLDGPPSGWHLEIAAEGDGKIEEGDG